MLGGRRAPFFNGGGGDERFKEGRGGEGRRGEGRVLWVIGKSKEGEEGACVAQTIKKEARKHDGPKKKVKSIPLLLHSVAGSY